MVANDQKIRVCLIGAGKIAPAHLDVISSFPNVSCLAIASRSGISAKNLALQYKISSYYSDYKQMLEEIKPDAVFILVSHENIFEVASYCLSQVVPCFIEKPPGLLLSQTQKLAEIAQQTSCFNMVGFNRRYSSVLKQAIEIITEHGALIGIHIEAHEPIACKRAEARLPTFIYDQWFRVNSVHNVDMLRLLGGDIEQVYSFSNSWKEKNGDSFVASIKYKSNALGSFIAHWNSGSDSKVVLYGDELYFEYNWGEQGIIHYADGRRQMITALEEDKKYKMGFRMQAKIFFSGLCGQSTQPVKPFDLRDSLQSMELMEKFLERS